MQRKRSWRALTVMSLLILSMPSLVVAAPCHKTTPMVVGQTVPCSGGLLTPEFIVREAVRCGAVELPRCQSELRLIRATQVDATLLTPAPGRPLVNARAWLVAVSSLAVGVIVGLALGPRVSLP